MNSLLVVLKSYAEMDSAVRNYEILEFLGLSPTIVEQDTALSDPTSARCALLVPEEQEEKAEEIIECDDLLETWGLMTHTSRFN